MRQSSTSRNKMTKKRFHPGPFIRYFFTVNLHGLHRSSGPQCVALSHFHFIFPKAMEWLCDSSRYGCRQRSSSFLLAPEAPSSAAAQPHLLLQRLSQASLLLKSQANQGCNSAYMYITTSLKSIAGQGWPLCIIFSFSRTVDGLTCPHFHKD